MRSPDILKSAIGLVGPGRAGSAFARSWRSAGGRLRWVVARKPSGPAPFGAEELYSPDEPRLPPCDIVVIAVPDDAIAAVAAGLSDRVVCRDAFHVSGALGSEAIAPLRSAGAEIASLHPVRPFTGDTAESWNGAFVAIEGDEGAAAVAERLVAAVGGEAYRLKATDRALYHASATLAAGGTAALVSVATRGWVAAGVPEDVARRTLGALASRAASAAAARPFFDAFTGAIARRDAGTVRGHLAALASHPEALALYLALAEETLSRTAGAGREEEIRKILGAISVVR